MGEKKGNFCFQKSPCRWQGLSWTEWAGQTRCPRPGPGIHAGMRMGSQALSDALAVSPGISPLTIKYIWSPRVTGKLLAGCLPGPLGLTAWLWGWQGCPWRRRGVALHLRRLGIGKGPAGPWCCLPSALCAPHRGGAAGPAPSGPPRAAGAGSR